MSSIPITPAGVNPSQGGFPSGGVSQRSGPTARPARGPKQRAEFAGLQANAHLKEGMGLGMGSPLRAGDEESPDESAAVGVQRSPPRTARNRPDHGARQSQSKDETAPLHTHEAAEKMRMVKPPRTQSPLAPARLWEQGIGRVPVSRAMAGIVGRALEGKQAPGPLPDDIKQRIKQNASVLVEQGVDTPGRVKAFLKTAWQQDARLTLAELGILDTAGNATPMTARQDALLALASNVRSAPKDRDPHEATHHPAMLGFLVGLGIASVEVMMNGVSGLINHVAMLNGREGNERLPSSVPVVMSHVHDLRDLMHTTDYRSLGHLLNLPAAALSALARPDRLVNLDLAGRVGITITGAAGGMVAAGARAMADLNDAIPYDARMLLREDLATVIEQSSKAKPMATGAVSGNPQATMMTWASVGALAGALLPIEGRKTPGAGLSARSGSAASADMAVVRRGGTKASYTAMAAWLAMGGPGPGAVRSQPQAKDLAVDPVLGLIRRESERLRASAANGLQGVAPRMASISSQLNDLFHTFSWMSKTRAATRVGRINLYAGAEGTRIEVDLEALRRRMGSLSVQSIRRGGGTAPLKQRA